MSSLSPKEGNQITAYQMCEEDAIRLPLLSRNSDRQEVEVKAADPFDCEARYSQSLFIHLSVYTYILYGVKT